ncbi:hypothetical protein CHU92_03090 [Flavobacterium cyanobacteriorum]|uniref:Uncharacterized protein n=1 Tax=Flavobacterium cyanobacteriorum TaxID=2022802 RepID=A0A255ZQM7_9FLAO|nr:hypothetical protein [Flavobacterium cyanobacteriorum]OYQ43692.1 hypothetical protein CHU92_03090 [Flavobacterium cyanobacteriorum]
MADIDLLNTAYKYFPKGIDNSTQVELFMNSAEIKMLFNLCIKEQKRKEAGDYTNFIQNIRQIDLSKHFFDATHFHLNDRAHNLQLAELINNKLYSVCLNVSIIVPFYITYVLEIDISYPGDNYRFPKISKPVRNLEAEKKYQPIMDAMAALTESFFSVTPFPEEKLHTIIPDISLETIRPGKFTFFNAFFLDDYYIMM